MFLLFNCPVMSNSLQPHGLQHTRPPCPSPSPEVCLSSCPLHRWCHPALSSSDALFSFCPQSFPASGTFSIVGCYQQVMLSQSVQSLSRVWLFVTPWIAARQASLSITNSWSSPKPTSIELVMTSSHLILCRPLFLLPQIPPSISLFQWVNCSHQMTKLLEIQLQHQSF